MDFECVPQLVASNFRQFTSLPWVLLSSCIEIQMKQWNPFSRKVKKVSSFLVCVCCVLVALWCPILLQPCGLLPTRLLCLWDSPGKNKGVVCHFLLQGIFPTQGLNLHLVCLSHCRWILYPLNHQGSLSSIFLWSLLIPYPYPSCPIFMAKDGETMETVRDFILGGSKITADGDWSHEIKRHLFLGRKAIINLDSILKSRALLCQQGSV